jgi:hypothetical protein
MERKRGLSRGQSLEKKGSTNVVPMSSSDDAVHVIADVVKVNGDILRSDGCRGCGV